MATCLVVGATTGPPQWPRKQCRPARWLWHQRRLPGHADGMRSAMGRTPCNARVPRNPLSARPPASMSCDNLMPRCGSRGRPRCRRPGRTTQRRPSHTQPSCAPGCRTVHRGSTPPWCMGGTPGWPTVGPASPLGRRAMGSALRVRPACGCRGRMLACRLWASPCWHPPDVSNHGSHGCGNDNGRGCSGPTRDL